MADSNKPRDIKDLKARLRKKKPTAAGSVAPGGVPGGPGAPGQGGPSLGAPSVAPPAAGIGRAPFPPVGRVGPRVPTPSMAPPQTKHDPFSAGPGAAAQNPNEVRLVVDDSISVDSAEAGRRSRGRTALVAAAAALIVGCLLGFVAGKANSFNSLFNQVVRDSKSVYSKVKEASATVLEVQRTAQGIAASALGAGGRPKSVDYAAIEKLKDIPRPFKASDFHGKRYSSFSAATVDQLFTYYNNVNEIWDIIEDVANYTLAPDARKTLDKAAEASTKATAFAYGMVIMRGDSGYEGTLTYLDLPGGETLPDKLNVATAPTGRRYSKLLFKGQDIAEKPDDYVVPINAARSLGILTQTARPFKPYEEQLAKLVKLLAETVELQGKLEKSLGEIARLQERVAL